jgi:hypothetical protein
MAKRAKLVRGQAMKRTCIDCEALYAPRGPRQQRCQSCAVEHHRKKNLEYQHAFRARHRTPEDAERLQCRTWKLDGVKSRAEMLAGEGLSATAISKIVGCSHHSVIRHLQRPEAQWRVGILRRLDMPELPC